MGLPVWSSVGYGSEEKPSNSKSEPTATRRSPIRRRSPTRLGFIRDPETGDVRSLRRHSGRRIAPPRAIPPQAPISQYRYPHRPFVHSPLVPSIPPGIDEQMRVTLAALERACVEALRISSDASAVVSPSSRPSLGELQSQIWTLSAQYRHEMRAHMFNVENFELALRRSDRPNIGNAESAFSAEIVSIIQLCDDGLRSLRALLARLVEESRQDISLGSNALQEHSPTEVEVEWSGSTSRSPGVEQMRRATRRRIMAGLRRDDQDNWASSHAQASVNESGGLGDRTRSASPDNEQDVWDTMRMTLQPDDQLPTADSSFTSAAASASFSAPTDSSRSSMESDSANTSRTSLTVPPTDDAACESDDSQDNGFGDALHVSDLSLSNGRGLPEVIPSPLVPQDYASRGFARRANDDRARLARGAVSPLPWIEDRPAPTWAARIGRDTPPPQILSDERLRPVLNPVTAPDDAFQYPFMPRSQSPLAIASFNQTSSGASSSMETTADSDSAARLDMDMVLSPWAPNTQRLAGISRRTPYLRVSPPPSTLTARTSHETHSASPQSRLADTIPAVVRLALRYAGVNSLDDPHEDPDLEHMRTTLQSLAGDGYVNVNDDDLWVGAGLPSMVVQSHPSRLTSRSPRTQEEERP